MQDHCAIHERPARVFDEQFVLVVGASRRGTARVRQCPDAHPEIRRKGDDDVTESPFPLLATASDDDTARAFGRDCGGLLKLLGHGPAAKA